MASESIDSDVAVHLTRQQQSAITELLFERMSQLRERIQIDEGERRPEELKERLRVLGSFVNSINGAETTDPETGLTYHTFDGSRADLRRLGEELEGLRSLVRPFEGTTGFHSGSTDVEQIATDLAGWAHRADEGILTPGVFFRDPSGYADD